MNELSERFASSSAQQSRVLLVVLMLNAALAATLATAGWTADSNGLMANALDNASDTGVYAVSLFAVGRGRQWKRLAAASSGALLLIFSVLVLADTLRRVIAGSEPIGPTMMAMALIAAGVNFLCLRLLKRLKGADINLRAAETFSLNDFASNGGILIAGAAVVLTGQRWPDLVVGLIVAAIAAKGGIDILRDAKNSTREQTQPTRRRPT